MKFTFDLPTSLWRESSAHFVDLARHYEAAGFDRFGVADWRYYPDLYVHMTACLVATERLALESLVTDPFVRHPALLDLLAGCKGFISSFCNQDAQKFLDQGGTTLDAAAQTAAYAQAEKVLATDPFGIYISADNALYGVSSKVSGWKAHGITVILGTNTTVSK